MNELFDFGGCLAVEAGIDLSPEAMDQMGKSEGLTIVYAAWHPQPEYRIFKTGTLASRNEDYPSGLVLVDERGKAQPWSNQ